MKARGFGVVALAVVSAAVFAVGATGSTSPKATVNVASTSALGAIVVGPTGRTLYHYGGDHGKTVACTGACAKLWPPLLLSKAAKPVAGTGITASKLGTLKRPDGSVQVTYDGFTLYSYTGDSRSGQVKGQAFASKWFVLGSSGALVKTNPSSSTGSGGSTSSGTTTSGGSAGYNY
jgi:predicted lipoprotein with Yx(FWY)xxD motif